MSNLGNLWFTLGLDDSKFRKQWDEAVKRYSKDTKAMIDVEISPRTIAALKNLKDMGGTAKQWNAVKSAAKAAGELALYEEKVRVAKEKSLKLENQKLISAERLNQIKNKELQTQNKINASSQKTKVTNTSAAEKEFRVQSLWLTNLKTMAANYLSIFAAKDFISNLSRISGEFEKQKVTLQAMVGQFEGSQLFSQIKELAVVSPFQFQDLASYTKQLAAFSVPYNELYDTTKSLADISAGLGVDMSRIILAYGQIRSAQVLKGTELRQLTEAGVPILEKLAEKFTQLEGRAVSVGEVFGKISKKLVPFSMVKDIFAEMTSEGGKFYNMQELQAETLAGKISNLTDAYQIMLSELGEQNEGALKGGVNILYKLIDNYELVGGAIKTAFIALTAYQAVQAIAFAVENIDKVYNLGRAIRILSMHAFTASKHFKMLNSSLKANAVGAILTVVMALGAAFYQVYQSSKRFNDEMNKMLNADLGKLRDEQYALEKLKKATEDAAVGSHDRREAINKINSRYGEYLDNMLNEASTADEIAAAYNRINEAMQNKFKQESLEKAKANVEEKYGDDINNAIEALERRFSKEGLTKIEGQDLTKLLRAYFESGKYNEAEIKKIFTDRVGKTLGVFNANEAINFELHDLKEAIKEYQQAMRDAEDKVNLRYAPSTYNTKAEADFIEQLTEKYKKLEEAIRAEEGANTEQVRKRLESLEKLKLQELAEAYANPEFFNNPALAKKYESQLETMEKVVADWAKKVKSVVGDENALIEFNPGDNEQLLDYLKSLNDRYNELLEAQKKFKNEDGTIVFGSKTDYDTIEQKLRGIKNIAKAINFTLTKDDANKTANLLQTYDNKLSKFLDDIALKTAEASKELSAISFEGLNEDEVTAKLRQINDEFDKGALKIEEYKTKFIQQWTAIQQAQAKAQGKVFDGTISVEDLPEEARALLNLLEQIIVKRREYNKLMLENSVIDKYATLEKQTADISAKFWKEFELGFGKEGFDFTQWNNAFKEALFNINKELDPIYKKIFGNISYMARDAIKDAIELAKGKLQEGGLTKEDEQGVIDRIKELQNASIELGEIDITTNISELIKRTKKLEGIKKLIEVTQDSASKTALQEQYDDEKRNLQLSKGAIAATAFANGLSLAANAMSELADATGDAKLADTAEKLSNVANTLSSVISGFATGGWIGALAGLATSLINNLVNGFVKAKIFAEQAAQGITDYSRAITLLRVQLDEDDYDTIFGVSSLSKVNEASKKAQEALNEYYNALNKGLENPKDTFDKKAAKNKLTDYEFKQLDAYKRGLTEIQGILVKTKDRSGFAEWLGWSDEYKALADYKPDLWDEDGSFNIQNAELFLETEQGITEEQKKQIQNVVNLHKAYEENLEIVNEYLEDIFSDTANTIADKMIDAFARTGDAATELGDIVNDIARSMASDLVQALLLDTYLKPAMDKVQGMYNMDSEGYISDSLERTQSAILAMKEGLAAAQAAVPEVNKILEALQATGIQLSENADTSSESASNVLSGLTEEQQNLMVSYMNGIRADVSINKGLLTSLVNYAGTINNNIALALVVWKQIEANTMRSADGVDRLIEHFESITGAFDGGGGQAIRVNIA